MLAALLRGTKKYKVNPNIEDPLTQDMATTQTLNAFVDLTLLLNGVYDVRCSPTASTASWQELAVHPRLIPSRYSYISWRVPRTTTKLH